jgi:hypothetical protein
MARAANAQELINRVASQRSYVDDVLAQLKSKQLKVGRISLT